jgi:hypothetical protein
MKPHMRPIFTALSNLTRHGVVNGDTPSATRARSFLVSLRKLTKDDYLVPMIANAGRAFDLRQIRPVEPWVSCLQEQGEARWNGVVQVTEP